ncbi:MAG: Rieske 2Fe-2S domain-containing protein [Cyanobacteriota bacterium]
MINDMWYIVLDSKEVKENKPLRVKRFNKELIFWRNTKKEIVCFDNLCVHGNIALSLKKTKDNCTYCSFNGFEFNEKNECIFIPVNGKDFSVSNKYKTKFYKVTELNGFICFWFGEERISYPKITFFDSIDESFSHGKTYKETFNTHFTRCIENHLNVAHLPFINEITLKKEKNSIINDILVEFENNSLYVWIDNKKVSKHKIKNKDLNHLKNNDPDVEFIFPNILILRISRLFYGFIIFAQEEDEKTVLYVRFHQKIISVKLLKAFFKVIDDFFSIKKIRTDKVIVESHFPKNSLLDTDEKLTDSELAIISFRNIIRNSLLVK